MTTRRELLAAAARLGPLSLAMRTAQATEGPQKTGQAAHKMADFLFVQNAKGIAYADGKLTLKGVSPATASSLLPLGRGIPVIQLSRSRSYPT